MKCKNISTAGATPLQRAVWTLCGSMALLALTPAVSAPADTAAGQGMANPGAGDMLSGESLQLVAGRQHLMALADAPVRIAVGDPNVLDVKLLRATPGSGSGSGSGASAGSGGTELLLTPKAQGSTSLVVWPRKGGVPQRWEVQVRGQHLLLEKRLASVPEHAQAVAELRLGAPAQTPLVDNAQIDVRSNTVQVDVQVVEFKKSAMKRVGVNIYSGGRNNQGFSFGSFSPGVVGSISTNTNGTGTGTGNTGSGGTGSGNTGSGSVSNNTSSAIASAMSLVMTFGKAFSGAGIVTQLSILEGNGMARVLARPTLLAQTGQNASFLAGGELPIPVPARDGNIAIQYKEFGIKLQLTPTILSDERIALKVSPEASDLDFNSGVTISGVTVPAIRTRRADTSVELADGESFVIGGLVSRATTSNVSKVPVLGDLPILGTFFKNLNYTQEETELVIIVTPRLVHPLPASTNLEALLPGARSEQRNAGKVWLPYLAGGMNQDTAVPGFSY
ncbi:MULTISPECIES: type II and III secretion system protein family protein [unclassified Delftia]|uniref:type II and III secretion system protein family protein n=1 Tax=unclassified Delftia TaxID=2613839 RepID=UPI000647CBA9|nr:MULTISPECIES: pilus assembly protein N-terminal domain-containing protein [unclassified Delftia]MDC2857100.1 pilus assembly protein N-terminal domain-containing protein [Delftia sp. DT-2]